MSRSHPYAALRDKTWVDLDSHEKNCDKKCMMQSWSICSPQLFIQLTQRLTCASSLDEGFHYSVNISNLRRAKVLIKGCQSLPYWEKIPEICCQRAMKWPWLNQPWLEWTSCNSYIWRQVTHNATQNNSKAPVDLITHMLVVIALAGPRNKLHQKMSGQ